MDNCDICRKQPPMVCGKCYYELDAELKSERTRRLQLEKLCYEHKVLNEEVPNE